ncbi:MAG: RDD family protein, partial [Phycisphaerae bacterium]
LVDYVLLGIFLTPVILYVGPDLPERLLRGETLPMDKVLLLELARIGLAVVYFTLAEGATGRTVGKALLGIEVRGVGGERATWKQALARNALRVVDEMPALYLVGLALVLIGPRPQRLGDRLARTLVVRSSKQGSAVG